MHVGAGRCYKIIEPNVYVGSAPYNQQHFEQILQQGFELFVDLTVNGEQFPDCTPLYNYTAQPNIKRYHYPITDRRAPNSFSKFHEFLKPVIEDMKTGKKTYIHCKGGHGRSGLTAAIILILIFNMDANQVLQLVYNAHQTRSNMNPKMRKLGAPQTAAQKKFVRDFYNYLYQV